MANLNLTAPAGWNKWIYPRTTVSENIQLPDASFPVIYTPASAFWLRSEIDHCLIPWMNVLDPLSSFFLSGGSAGSLAGTVGALGVVNNILNLFQAQGTWSAFGPYAGPRFGYCIGDKFKQEAYVRFDIMNSAVQVILLNAGVELLENSKFKRIYVIHGEVVNFNVVNGKNLLTVDINNPIFNNNTNGDLNNSQDNKDDVSGTQIKITKPNGTSYSLNISGITDNWNIIVSDPPKENVPTSGDFYELNSVWCIENPYLISGFLKGSENELSDIDFASGLNLFVSEHNSPFQKSQFLGVYILKDKNTGTIVPATYGSNMRDLGDNEWCFYGFGNSQNISETYKDDSRYKEVILNDPDGEGSIVKYEPRKTASDADYNMLRSKTDFIRVEINGGYFNRQNWQSPCLMGSYVNISGKFYKIIAHVEANVIDVNIKSVDGTSTFNPSTNREYTILNQYAWIINENYFTSTDMLRSALFEGKVTTISLDKIELKTKDPVILSKIKHGFSLADRYKKQVASSASQSTETSYVLPSTMKKIFFSKQNWKLISGSKAGNISSISFGNPEEDGTYIISMNVANMSLSVNDDCYITFDNPFKTISGKYTSKGGYSFDLSVANGLSAKKGQELGFAVSDVLCLSGEYFSYPIYVDVPVDTRIGVCDGYLFGIAANGSAQNREGVFMLATTPRSGRGMSSLFHILREEGWIAYQDIVTKRITIRRGSEEFRESPMKNMVAIGQNAIRESVDGTTEINLNTDYDWLRRIQFIEPVSQNHGIMFATGNPDNMYGFYISGDGVVNLNLLKVQGVNVANVSSSIYTSSEGYPVSPVYAYTKEFYNNYDNFIVDIGIQTIDGPVYIKDGTISGVKAEYVKDNQTLSEDVGFFDIVRLPHGETVMLYGSKIGEFTVNGKMNNSTSNNTAWNDKNAVMIIGTYDDTYSWSAPLVNRMDDTPQVKQYPIMLMNSVDYLSCLFDHRKSNLNIFARCFQDGEPYIGCFSLSIIDVLNNLMLCSPVGTSASDTPLSFSYRHPAFIDNFINDKTKFWTQSIINSGFSYTPDTMGTLSDRFVRVMGSGQTGSQVTNQNEPGIVSTHLLPDGTQILLYDGEGGVKAIFSNDSGWTWMDCQIIYGKDARSGFLLGQYLFYITSSGIEMRLTSYVDFYQGRDLLIQKNAGKDITDLEIELQSNVDKDEHFLIGSGVIEPQRLSGYITHNRLMKIFFYDQNNLLKCMESKDIYKWEVANNF
jgi:hypothetical protein